MATTRRYFRVQPAGLGLDHRSETSACEMETVVDEELGEIEVPTDRPVLADGLHVFLNANEAESLNESPALRLDSPEVVVIEADHHWENEDVEGVCIDGSKARIVARVPHSEFRAAEWE